MKKLKAIVLLGVCVVVLAAAMWLLIVNAGNEWELHFFVKTIPAKRWSVMLISALAGAAMYLILRTCLPAGLRTLKSLKAAKKSQAAEKRLADLESPKPPPSDQ